MTEKALLLLEEAYTKFLMGNSSEKGLCRDIEIALGALPFDNKKKEFKVQVTNHHGNDRFFGMRVFPTIKELDTFCQDLVNEDSVKMVRYNDMIKRWKRIDSWFLELDGILFDRSRINFTPKELVALTLHEIGHIIYSDKPMEGFYRAYREAKVRMTISDKATQKLMYNIYMVPLTVACMQRRWVNGKNEVNIEIVADKTVAELGYGNYLVEAFDKIMRYFGSIDTNENQNQAELNSSIEWCNKNIADLMKRKEHLKDELYYMGIKTKSNYLKAMTIILLDKLGIKLRERYTGYAVENCIELLNDPNLMEKYEPYIDVLESAKFDARLQAMQASEMVAMEAIFNRRKKVKTVLPSAYEIDAIAVEVDKITNHHDRIFVLDLIYEMLDRINTFEEAISPDPSLVRKWSGKIKSMKDELEQLRQATLAKKNFSSGYKFFMKLPPEAEEYAG